MFSYVDSEILCAQQQMIAIRDHRSESILIRALATRIVRLRGLLRYRLPMNMI